MYDIEMVKSKHTAGLKGTDRSVDHRLDSHGPKRSPSSTGRHLVDWGGFSSSLNSGLAQRTADNVYVGCIYSENQRLFLSKTIANLCRYCQRHFPSFLFHTFTTPTCSD